MIAGPASAAWYVYGVVDASSAPAPDGVELVGDGALAAVVASVPLSEFGEEALAERLNDREWLETHARAHEGVLHRVAERASVVPFRFGVIYRDLADVSRMLRDRRTELTGALERVRGRAELGVKAWADRAGIEESPAAVPEGSSGRAYLERRRTEQERARNATALIAAIAQDAHARLVRSAVDGVANRPQPRELTGRDETMILNGAYLVADGGGALVAEIRALEEEHGARGISFEVTGPWPPYNFVERAEDA